jgi:hypothetical protein
MDYRLLNEFRRVFEGRKYRHRASNQGDFVAIHLFEDLRALNRSAKLTAAISSRQRVVNTQNKRRGVIARRGDGTFGEIIPGVEAVSVAGFAVARGPVATVEIGCEVKILAKAMIKQIDRVITDLKNQADAFKRGGGTPICVGIVGINCARETTSYEKDREYRTDGKHHKHPYQEAAEAERRLRDLVEQYFDDFLVLRYIAANVAPFAFEWVDYQSTMLDYGAILTRISRKYDQRF